MKGSSYCGIPISIPENCNTEEKREEFILNALADACDMEISEKKLENELNAMILEIYQENQRNALISGNFNYHIREDIEAQMESLRKTARRRLKLDRILQDIIKKEALNVSAEELEAEAKDMAERQGVSVEAVRDFLGPDFEMLRGDLLTQKAVRLICSNAVVV